MNNFRCIMKALKLSPGPHVLALTLHVLEQVYHPKEDVSLSSDDQSDIDVNSVDERFNQIEGIEEGAASVEERLKEPQELQKTKKTRL